MASPTTSMTNPVLLALLSSWLLIGCLDVERAADPGRASVGLAGTDVDQDGVRDDIAAHINSSFRIEAQRRAALQAARAMQEVFTVDLEMPLAVREVNSKLARADHCLYLTFEEGNDTRPAAEVSSELESMATDTSERLQRYMAFNRALDGAVWPLPRGNTCE